MGVQEKRIIHLQDLPNSLLLGFNYEGLNILREIINYLKDNIGLDTIKRRYNINFYCLYNLTRGKQQFIKINLLKDYLKFISKLGFNVNLERNINEIKPLKGNSLKIKNGLPINLGEENWAYIIGIILDSYLRNVTLKDMNENFIKIIQKKLKNIGVNTNYKKIGNVLEIRSGSIIGHLISIGGIKTNGKQIINNTSLPSWIWEETNKKYHAILLSKFFDTEGCAPHNKRGNIRIAQSSFLKLNNKDRLYIENNYNLRKAGVKKNKYKTLIHSNLNNRIKKKTYYNKPKILLDIQKLLKKYNINSRLYLNNLTVSERNVATISWHLNITHSEEIRKFYDLCGKFISIKTKKEKIEKYLSYKRRKQFSPGLRYKIILDKALDIQKEKGYFLSKDILIRKNNTIRNILLDLKKENKIENIGKLSRFKMWKVNQDLTQIYP